MSRTVITMALPIVRKAHVKDAAAKSTGLPEGNRYVDVLRDYPALGLSIIAVAHPISAVFLVSTATLEDV